MRSLCTTPRQLHYLPYQQHLAPYHGYQSISGASHAKSMIRQQTHHGYQSTPDASHARSTYQHPQLSMASASNLGVAYSSGPIQTYSLWNDPLTFPPNIQRCSPGVGNGAVNDNKNNKITDTTDMGQSWLKTELTLPSPFVDPSVLVNPSSSTPPSSFADPSTLPTHTSFTWGNEYVPFQSARPTNPVPTV